MKKIVTLDDAIIARYELARFMLDSGSWWLGSTDGRRGNIPSQPSQIEEVEWSVEWGRLILSWWDENQARRLRITGYRIEPNRIIVEGQSGLGTEPRQLVFDRPIAGREAALAVPPESLPARRIWYAEQLAQLIGAEIPGIRLRRWSTGANLRHRVPGRYGRFVLTSGHETILAIGASAAETPATIEGITAAGLVWLHNYNLERSVTRQARQLWFFLPRDQSLTVLERLPLLRPGDGSTRVAVYETDEIRRELRSVRPVSQLELLTSSPRDLHWPPVAGQLDRLGRYWHEQIMSLTPPAVIESRYRPGRRLISYAIHGLEFARLPIDDAATAEFGISGDPAAPRPGGRPLTARSLPALQSLVDRLSTLRRPDSPDIRHPFYRLRTEAWLESLLRRNIRTLDPELDPDHVYSQIPAWHADQRSIIDLLAIRRDGRLAVIEIKATEDPQLPLQGLDYWMRVEQARLRGEFGRHGLFAGLPIANRSPILYLVAPRLRFHRSFATIGRCLHPEIEAYRVGLNTDWRAGVRVHTLELLQSL